MEGAPAAHAFLSQQADGFVTDLCRVKRALTERKPHDDFCGLPPVGAGPQIKLGNDLVENFQEEHDRLRIEDSSLQHATKRHDRASKWKPSGNGRSVGRM